MRFPGSLTAVLAVTLLGLVACGSTNTVYASEDRADYGGWEANLGDPDGGSGGASAFSLRPTRKWAGFDHFPLNYQIKTRFAVVSFLSSHPGSMLRGKSSQ